MAVQYVWGEWILRTLLFFPCEEQGQWPGEHMTWWIDRCLTCLTSVPLAFATMHWSHRNKIHRKRSNRIAVIWKRTPELNFGGKKEVHSILTIWESYWIRSAFSLELWKNYTRPRNACFPILLQEEKLIISRLALLSITYIPFNRAV